MHVRQRAFPGRFLTEKLIMILIYDYFVFIRTSAPGDSPSKTSSFFLFPLNIRTGGITYPSALQHETKETFSPLSDVTMNKQLLLLLSVSTYWLTDLLLIWMPVSSTLNIFLGLSSMWFVVRISSNRVKKILTSVMFIPFALASDSSSDFLMLRFLLRCKNPWNHSSPANFVSLENRWFKPSFSVNEEAIFFTQLESGAKPSYWKAFMCIVNLRSCLIHNSGHRSNCNFELLLERIFQSLVKNAPPI